MGSMALAPAILIALRAFPSPSQSSSESPSPPEAASASEDESSYDSRDSIFTPDSGISATAQATLYDEALGSDRTLSLVGFFGSMGGRGRNE